MSDWVPHEAVAPARSASSRIRRGFSRIGVGVAVLIFLIGSGISVVVVASESFDDNAEFDKWACVLRLNGDRRLTGEELKRAVQAASGCGYISTYGTLFSSLEWTRLSESLVIDGARYVRVPQSSMWSNFLRYSSMGVGVSAVTAGFAYLFFWGLGWVVSGFARDEYSE